MQVLQEARLVDRHQRAQAHRHRGELPEVGHQLRMRIARQPLAVHFLAEVQQLFLGDAAFQVGAGVDARRRVPLDVEQVAAVLAIGAVPEVVEAAAQHRRQRRERGQVAAQVAAVGRVQAIGLDDHRHRVPAHVGTQALFDVDVAGELRLVGRGDGVDVRGVRGERQVDALLARVIQQLLDQEVAALAALDGDDGRQRVGPFAGFLRIAVVGGGARKGLGNRGHALSPDLCRACGLNRKRPQFRTTPLGFQMAADHFTL